MAQLAADELAGRHRLRRSIATAAEGFRHPERSARAVIERFWAGKPATLPI